mgnify:CR=1 FL=1
MTKKQKDTLTVIIIILIAMLGDNFDTIFGY